MTTTTGQTPETRRKKRDLTKAQFRARCAKEGFRDALFGYWYVTPDDSIMVYAANGGDRLRDRLAYLRKQRAKHAAAEGSGNA